MGNKRKTVYIIRHGEATSNTGNVRGDSNAKLTPKGIKQSLCLAHKCKIFNADVLYSSKTKRAKETAEIISKVCKLSTNYLSLLNERRLPSEIRGKNKDNPAVVEIDRTIRSNFHINNYRFSDEENFDDLKSRSLQVINLLDQNQKSTFILVTHGIFMRVLVACAIFGENITARECEMFIRGLRMEKTGITTLKLNTNLKEEGLASRWQLWVWNEHTHLYKQGESLIE